MCTLIVLDRCVPQRPLVVAANRDEFLDRPAEEPALRFSRTGPIVAPLDLEAGGTWVGVSARGVFAGLTNLRPAFGADLGAGPGPQGPKAWNASEALEALEVLEERIERARTVESGLKLKSRGDVVMMALEAESAEDAIRTLSKLERDRYNPFQLLVADGHAAWLMVYRGSPRVVRLEPGAHIVGNVVDERIEAEISDASKEIESSPVMAASEEPRARKLTRIRARVEKLMTEPGQDYFEGLARICREHIADERNDGWSDGSEDHSPFESTCVHVANRYGTRSSLMLEISTDPTAHRLWTTNGPPCERPFENRSSLLRELGLRLSDQTRTKQT